MAALGHHPAIRQESFFEKIQHKFASFCDSSSSPINKYVILPISQSNSFRNKVIIVSEIALVALNVCAFSATVHLTLKTVSILGKGIGIITGFGLLDCLSLLVADIARRMFMDNKAKQSPEELCAHKFRNYSFEEFKQAFHELTGLDLETSYPESMQKKIEQETDCQPYYKGLIPIIVRFSCLKAQLENKERSKERFVMGKKRSKSEKALIQEMINKKLLEVFVIKLEVACALLIIKDPFIPLQEGLEEIGYFNEVVFSSDATHFLETDLPYFIGNDQQDLDDLDKNSVISFQQMQELSIKKLAKKLKKMIEA